MPKSERRTNTKANWSKKKGILTTLFYIVVLLELIAGVFAYFTYKQSYQYFQLHSYIPSKFLVYMIVPAIAVLYYLVRVLVIGFFNFRIRRVNSSLQKMSVKHKETLDKFKELVNYSDTLNLIKESEVSVRMTTPHSKQPQPRTTTTPSTSTQRPPSSSSQRPSTTQTPIRPERVVPSSGTSMTSPSYTPSSISSSAAAKDPSARAGSAAEPSTPIYSKSAVGLEQPPLSTPSSASSSVSIASRGSDTDSTSSQKRHEQAEAAGSELRRRSVPSRTPIVPVAQPIRQFTHTAARPPLQHANSKKSFFSKLGI